MVSVGIIGLGAYVPPNEMSNEDWMEYVDTSDEWTYFILYDSCSRG